VPSSLWDRCVQQLRSDLPEQQFNTWIRPLQAVEEPQLIRLLAPNRFVVDWVNGNCLGRITDFLRESPGMAVQVEVGSLNNLQRQTVATGGTGAGKPKVVLANIGGKLNPEYTFDKFVSRWPATPAGDTTRSSSTAAWAWARPT
jgi:chromosomal replication initiator protein